jgi:hypothetical protein
MKVGLRCVLQPRLYFSEVSRDGWFREEEEQGPVSYGGVPT